jgi:multiple sugar transport system permease protein
MTALAVAPAKKGTPGRRSRVATHAVLMGLAVLWLAPILWALYTSLRPESDTNKYGYASLAHALTFQNYSDAWTRGQIPHFFKNTVVITVPAVLITLFLASCVAFVVARFSFRFNLLMLVLFTAGNLLPQQVLLSPLFKLFVNVHVPTFISGSGTLYDSAFGLIVINVSFQTGFCVFVLSNFMRTIPEEITEAGMVDGASVWSQYWNLTLPLCRPAMAALATLLTTWIYNDFFWALTLMSTGDKLPITTAINNLKGVYGQDANLLSAGAMIIALPTLVVYLVLQRQFIAGLTLGSTKG